MNLADVLRATAAEHPERAAVTDLASSRTLTYAELARESERVAVLLRGAGVARGARIGLVAPNSIEHVAAAFGLLASGACLVPLAANLTPTEAAQVAREVQLNGCLRWNGGFRFDWMDRAAAGPCELLALNPAFIRFTSGTTASSKGVVLSHEATLARVEAADRVLGLDRTDRILWVLPLAYHFAVTIVAYVRAGAHVLLASDTRPAALLEAIREAVPTVLYASPLHFERLGNLPGDAPLASLRLCLSTSAPITATVMERFERAHGVTVGQAYGIIEAGLPCINTRVDGTAATSVGRPVPGYEVALFADDGSPAPAGTPGEIGVRGAGLFSAYYAPWRRREQLTRNGWFMTGDVGRLDERGALHLHGRKKTVIFVAGLKFFPEEVEACINAFPGVVESRVFGRAHAHLGQVPCAEVVAHAGTVDVDALRAHCAHVLSSYKVPVEFRLVGTVPRTPGGKILRRA